MTENSISIVGLQEARSPHSKRETRKAYTLHFSGNGLDKCQHGVGIVIRSDLAKHIEDTELRNERLTYIMIAGTLPTQIIGTYMPTCIDPTETKDEAYDNFQNHTTDSKAKDPHT